MPHLTFFKAILFSFNSQESKLGPQTEISNSDQHYLLKHGVSIQLMGDLQFGVQLVQVHGREVHDVADVEVEDPVVVVVHAQDVAQREGVPLGGEEGLDLRVGREGDCLGGRFGFGLGRLDAYVKQGPASCLLQMALSDVIRIAHIVSHFFSLKLFHHPFQLLKDRMTLHNNLSDHIKLIMYMERVISLPTLTP